MHAYTVSVLVYSLPLAQAKQKFSAMDVHIRDKLKDWMIESARKFG